MTKLGPCLVGVVCALCLLSCSCLRREESSIPLITSHSRLPLEEVAMATKLSLPPPFALAVCRAHPDSRLVAWGSVVLNQDVSKKEAAWALLVDKEMVKYLVNIRLAPSVLEKISDETSWSPYLLTWSNPPSLPDEEEHLTQVTSFQMRMDQYRQAEKCPFGENGLPVIEKADIEYHIYLFGELAAFRGRLEGFVLVHE